MCKNWTPFPNGPQRTGKVYTMASAVTTSSASVPSVDLTNSFPITPGDRIILHLQLTGVDPSRNPTLFFNLTSIVPQMPAPAPIPPPPFPQHEYDFEQYSLQQQWAQQHPVRSLSFQSVLNPVTNGSYEAFVEIPQQRLCYPGQDPQSGTLFAGVYQITNLNITIPPEPRPLFPTPGFPGQEVSESVQIQLDAESSATVRNLRFVAVQDYPPTPAPQPPPPPPPPPTVTIGINGLVVDPPFKPNKIS